MSEQCPDGNEPAEPGREYVRTCDAEAAVQDVPDGAGCTEIWEYLSERRESKSE